MIKAAALLVALALAGILFMQWRDWPRPLAPLALPTSDPAAAGQSGTPTDALATTPAPPVAKETYAAVTERPLFRPQRKPEPPKVDAAPPDQSAVPDGSLEGVDLSAILIAPGPGLTSAWIKDPSAPTLKRLRLGDEQAGWLVKTIAPDRVVFERQGETNELLLLDLSQPQAAPPAPPVPARPAPPARPIPAAQRPAQSPPRGPQRAPAPGADKRFAPPQPPQLKPNVRRATPP